MTRYYKPVPDTPASAQVAAKVGQVRSHEGRDWLVTKIQGGMVELQATGVAVGAVTMVRSKFWVKRWMEIK